ncbi:MAG: hypothetical protein AB1696_11500 [Planctomycetota bacterium]
MAEKSGWEQRRTWVGFVACWILIIVGLVFVIAGLMFCRATIERPAEEFRYSFVPLFVLVSIGLILMLGGSIGMMHIEISSHDEEVARNLQKIKRDIQELLDRNDHKTQEEESGTKSDKE